PQSHLSFLANVYNHKARAFYQRYGVKLIDAAYEAHEEPGDVPVMITKHCLRFSFNLCPKQAKGVTGVRTKVAPMQLVHGDEVLTLKFDCKPCEMHVIGKMRSNIFHAPPPGSGGSVVGSITPEDLLKTIPRRARRAPTRLGAAGPRGSCQVVRTSCPAGSARRCCPRPRPAPGR